MGLFSFLRRDAKSDGPEDKFNDNMNYRLYAGTAVFLGTGRKRKFTIEAFSEAEAIEEAAKTGYDRGGMEIERIPFEPPTEAQLEAMKSHRNKVPEKACKIDVSFIIQKKADNQPDAEKALVDFATSQKVKFSYYTGEQSLYMCIWNSFSLNEKIAFYILCVNRDLLKTWNFQEFQRYLKLAERYSADERFMNSFKRYSAPGKSFLGFRSDGESRNTNCYKIISGMLKGEGV